MMNEPAYIEALVTGALVPPTERELAELLALIGDERASALRTLLWLIRESSEGNRMVELLWQRAVDAMTDKEGVSGMLAALDVESDLVKLKAALPEISWKDPAEVLDPKGEIGVDIPPILSLAQEQFVAGDTKDRELGDVIIRLLQYLDVLKQRDETE